MIIETDSHLVIAALSGDAAAGGVPFALAADHVVAREDVVLNPYYQHMGGLYGSEYWTYLLPRRVGHAMTAELAGTFTAVGTRRAVEIGLIDAAFGDTVDSFRAQLGGLAARSHATPTCPTGSRTSAATARATSRSSPSPPTAARRRPARTSASSEPTAPTTRRAAASSTSSARPARCRSR
jgi:putative two-component system protein, hydrogenase maturation factor HypX/HoxX